MRKKVIIIGAGPAGLTAAWELLSRSNEYEVTILESSGDIGGISKTVNYKGNRIDIGGHRFFSKSDRVMDWWLKMMPVEASAPHHFQINYHGKSENLKIIKKASADDNDVMLVRSRKSRIYFLRKFFNYPISLSFETIRNLGALRMLRIILGYTKARLFPIKPEITLEDFFINRFGKELYLTFFKDYTEKVWGFKCNEISKDWGAQRVKGLSISKTISHAFKTIFRKDSSVSQKNTETSLIERFLYPKFGPGQLWEKVAKLCEDKGAKLLMHHECVGFTGNAKKIECVLANHQGNSLTFQADVIFSTMPIKDLFNGFQFDVPEHIKHIATTLPYRDFITVGLLCKKLLVEENHQRITDNWIYIQERDVKMGRLQIFNNWSPYMVDNEENTWVGLEYFCNEGDALWSMSDEDFSQFAAEEFVKIGMVKKSDILDSTIIRMKKTYPAYTGSYAHFDEVKNYLNGIINLIPIGRNGMHKYNNSDHSMLTAMTAVDHLISGITDKSDLWLINTEESYHETK